MKKLLLLIVGYLVLSYMVMAQATPSNKVVDKLNGKPIQGAIVKVYGPVDKTLKASASGLIDVSSLPNGKYTIMVTAPGYEAFQQEWVVDVNKKLPIIALIQEDNTVSPFVEDMPLLEDLSDDINNDERSSGALLTSSRDPFNNASNYVFSSARFNARGFAAEYSQQYLNGVPMNDINTGYNVWALWGGLNDVFRNQTSSTTFEPLEYGFGQVGVSNNVETRASSYGPRRLLTYSNSNRTYTNRAMFTYSTGLMKNGWAIAGSISRRWGDGLSSYVRGTFYDATSIFLSVEKNIDENNSLNLMALAAPTRRGVASASSQEAYNLVGSNYYNPNMGIQNGKWRNARVKSNFEPLVQLSHYFEPSNDFKLTTTLSIRTGWNKYSALNWYNAPDPRADYYRYLPSYFTWMSSPNNQDKEAAELYKELWQTDRNVRYIDWDQLYDINRNNLTTIYDANGKALVRGRRALYMIEDRHMDQTEWAVSSRINWNALSWLKVDAGVNYRNNMTQYYDAVGDLLGADFVYDIDKFAERDFGGDSEKVQIDLNHPDHIAYKGDRFGYDYRAYRKLYNIWTNLQYDLGDWQAYTAFNIDYTNIYRRGMHRRGLFPNNSFGDSKELNFLSFSTKAGLTYKISGHQYLSVNGLFVQKAPTFRSAFISPRTRNTFADNLKNQNIYSAEASYIMRFPYLSGRLTGFYTYTDNGIKSMSFYDDSHSAFSNFSISDIATRQMGLEGGLEAKLTTTISANGAVSLMSNKYANNPSYIQTVDNSATIIDNNIVYWNGLNMANGPQTAATIGLTYRAPWYGIFGINANYFGRNYISMNPTIRTDVARSQLDYKYIKPEAMKGGYTVDIFASYSYRITWDTYLRFNLSINNILNNKNIVSSGYEQLRVRTRIDDDRNSSLLRPFPSKYSYLYGTTFFFNASLQF